MILVSKHFEMSEDSIKQDIVTTLLKIFHKTEILEE